MPSSLASRSHRDNVGWQIPVRIESADAVGPPGTINFFTMLALKASLYSVTVEPQTPPASMPSTASSRGSGDRTTPLTQGGDKLFVDYSGKKPRIVDPATGEVIEVELFVAVLGASNFTYAEATRTQQVPDWIGSHVRALAAIGGVPRAVVPDQLKSGVTVACRYEPGIQRTYEEMAQHYGTVILPARPAHPRDKAKVEAGVRVAQRWILARIRNQTFFSLAELNARIAELVAELNAYRMRVYGASRRELFEKLDRPALGALPAERFAYGEWKAVKVNIDYHVEYDASLLLGPAHAAGRRPRCARDAHDRRDLSRHGATDVARAQPRAWPPHDEARAHAEEPPEAPGVDAVADRELGREHRARRRGSSRARSSPSVGTPSRATARASASSGCRSATAPSDSRPRVRAR